MDAKLKIHYAFLMPSQDPEDSEVDIVYEDGDTYTVTLPSSLRAIADFSVINSKPLYVGNSDSIFAHLTVSASGIATLTFTDFFVDENNSEIVNNFEGWFELDGVFSEEKIKDAEPPIEFSFAGQAYQISFEQPAVPDVNIGISKTGVYDKATDEIVWTVTVTPEGSDPVSGVYVTDTYASNQTYVPGSFQVNGASVADPGEGVQTDLAISDRSLTYTFPEAIEGEQTITLRTKPTDMTFATTTGKTEFKNNAEAYLTGIGKKAESEGKVTLTWIAKGGTADNVNREIDWTVTVNQSALTLQNAMILDILPAGLDLVGESVKLGSTSVSEDPTGLLPNTYTYDAATRTLTYRFNTPLTQQATLYYTTSVVGDEYYDSNTKSTFTNNAKLVWGGNATGPSHSKGVGVGESVISKSSGNLGNYDHTNPLINWTITINKNKISITSPKVTDTLPAGLTLVEGSVTLKIGSGETQILTAGESSGQYTYSPSTDSTTGSLTYSLASLNDVAVLTLTTEVRESFLQTQRISHTFTNTGKLTTAEIPSGITATAQVTVKNPIMEKKLSYDPGSDYIKWIVPINSNQIDLAGITITDALHARLTLDETSVRLYAKVLKADGSLADPDGGPVLIPAEDYSFSYTPDDGNLFTVTLPGESADAYQLEFITDITGTNSLTINNTIYFSGSIPSGSASSGSNTFTIDASGGGSGGSASITVLKEDEAGQPLAGAKFVLSDKTGDLRELVTNESGQVTFSGLRFKTFYVREVEAPDNYLLNPQVQSVRLTSGDAAKTLTFTNDPALGTITFVKHNDRGTPLAGAQFTLYNTEGGVVATASSRSPDGVVTFTGIPLGTYSLTETRAPGGYRIPAENKDIPVTVSRSADHTAVIVSLDPDTALVNEKVPFEPTPFGGIQIKKTDGEGAPLSGAEFTLYDSKGAVVDTASSGTDGLVIFADLRYGTYTVRETGVPEGYKGSDDLITVNVQRAAYYEYTVENLLLEEPKEPEVPGGGKDPEDPKDPDETEDLTDPNAPGGGAKPDPNTDASPQTGSPSFYPLWLMLLFSLTGIGVVLRYPKKRRSTH